VTYPSNEIRSLLNKLMEDSQTNEIRSLLNKLMEDSQISPDFAEATSHRYGCRCDSCKQWWVKMGPTEHDVRDEWSYGPFSEEEYVAAGGKVISDPPSVYFAKEVLDE